MRSLSNFFLLISASFLLSACGGDGSTSSGVGSAGPLPTSKDGSSGGTCPPQAVGGHPAVGLWIDPSLQDDLLLRQDGRVFVGGYLHGRWYVNLSDKVDLPENCVNPAIVGGYDLTISFEETQTYCDMLSNSRMTCFDRMWSCASDEQIGRNCDVRRRILVKKN